MKQGQPAGLLELASVAEDAGLHPIGDGSNGHRGPVAAWKCRYGVAREILFGINFLRRVLKNIKLRNYARQND